MKIVYLAAGAAGNYCGACARDAELARALMARGHDVLMLPLYTPLTIDGPDPSTRRVFYGGINAYLQQKSGLFRRTPRFLDRLLDNRRLLRAVSRLAIDTRPEDLGEMTVSVLRGAEGRQAKELDKLLRFLQRHGRPDIVNLTNSLLSGLVPAIKERLGSAVVCTLQGEESFADGLPEPYCEQALDAVREHAKKVDLFISPGIAYADQIAEWLQVPRERIEVVRPGVDVEVFHPAATSGGGPFRIGFLSRITPSKGTDILCQAFAALEALRPGRAQLGVAGQLAAGDRPWWEAVCRDLREKGLAERFDHLGRIGYARKISFLQGLSVFVRPSRFPERRAVAALEAMACGVPLVVPRSGIFTEVVELTGGGVLVEGEEAGAFAAAIIELMEDPSRHHALSESARKGARQHFSSDVMAEATLAAYRLVLDAGK